MPKALPVWRVTIPDLDFCSCANGMDLNAAAIRVAGMKTQEYATELENLAKNISALLNDITDRQVLDIAKSTVKPRLEKAHAELTKAADSLARIK